MKLVCEFCQNSFTTNIILKNHQKTARYCIEKQNKKSDITNIFNCDGCKKEFLKKSNLSRHEKSCIYILTKQNDELKKQLNEKEIEFLKKINEKDIEFQKNLNEKEIELKKQLNEITSLKEEIISYKSKIEIYKEDKDCLHKIALQPKTNNNNNNITNNLGILNLDTLTRNIQSALENICVDDILDGQKSIARLVAPCFVEDDGTKLLSCSDISRSIFAYKDVSGSVIKDLQCAKIARTIEPFASQKASEFIIKDYEQKAKSNRLKLLKKRMEEIEVEIENLENHQKGYKIDSYNYRIIHDNIENLHDAFNDSHKELKMLEEAGITHDDDVSDNRLMEAEEDISLLKTDSKKFAKELASQL